MGTRISARLRVGLPLLVVLIGGAHQALAERAPRAYVETDRLLRLQVDGLLGAGSDEVTIGSLDGDDVRVSGGGGLGGAATLGYGFSRYWDFDVSAGFQRSPLHDDVPDGDASFRRKFFLATLKYKIPLSPIARIKLGLGGGLYAGGELEWDTTDAVNGEEAKIKYRDAVGVHATTELETFLAPRLSLVLGAKFYAVEYEADSFRVNGESVSTHELKHDLRHLDGSGVDLTVGLAAYF